MRTPIGMAATLGVLGIEPVREGSPLHRCPRCGHGSLKVRDDAVWFCHACQEGGNAAGLAAFAWKVPADEARPRLLVALGLPPDGEADGPDDLLARVDDLESERVPDPAPVAAILRRYEDLLWGEADRARLAGATPAVADAFAHDTVQMLRDAATDGLLPDAGAATRLGGLAIAGIRSALDRLGVRPLPAAVERIVTHPSPSTKKKAADAYMRMQPRERRAFDEAVFVIYSLAEGRYRQNQAFALMHRTGIDVQVVLADGAGERADARLKAARRKG